MGRIIVGSDHAGLPLKEPLVALLRERGCEVEDVDTNEAASVDYPDFGHRVAKAVASGEHTLGLLVCGSGIGMSITAVAFLKADNLHGELLPMPPMTA